MKKTVPLFRLPNLSSFRSNSSFGHIRKFLIVFISFALIFLSTSTTSKVLAQSATTVAVDITPTNARIIGGQQTSFKIQLVNFSDPDGLAAFSFKLKYDPNFYNIADSDGDGKADTGKVVVGPFLGSTGKQVACSSGYIDKDTTDSTKKLLTFSCVTLGPTPTGPTGNGLLATIYVTTGTAAGLSNLTLVTTELVANTSSANLITHTAVSGVFRNVKCADMTGDRFVAITDIYILAQKYGWTLSHPNWDPKYDIVDNNNYVTMQDLFWAAREYGMTCP